MIRLAALTLLALLSACAIPQTITPRIAPASVSFAQAQRVEVHLSDYAFDPRTLSLAAGRPTVLVLINDAARAHSFSAPDFFVTAQMAAPSAPLVTDGLIEVAAGSRVELQLVPTVGGYDVECTHTGHSLRGMTGSIVVR